MAEIEFEGVGLRVTHVLRNGRRRFDAASKERLVSACLRPGSSISGLALAHVPVTFPPVISAAYPAGNSTRSTTGSPARLSAAYPAGNEQAADAVERELLSAAYPAGNPGLIRRGPS